MLVPNPVNFGHIHISLAGEQAHRDVYIKLIAGKNPTPGVMMQGNISMHEYLV